MDELLVWHKDGIGQKDGDKWGGVRFSAVFEQPGLHYQFLVAVWMGNSTPDFIQGEYYFTVRDLKHNKRQLKLETIQRKPATSFAQAKEDARNWLYRRLEELAIERGTNRKLSSAIKRN